MPDILPGHIYDYPQYYDLLFGSDWKAEFRFLQKVFERHAKRPVKRLFEPACGTGRLLIKFAEAGFAVAGNDLNEKAVAFCNARLKRFGFPATAVVGDMADFTLKRKADAAFNMINSVRHLPNEKSAESHLKCVAAALSNGGLYVLGLHLTPTEGPRIEVEEWAARRGNLSVLSRMWSIEIDLKKRNERVGMTFDVYTPTKRQRINDEMDYRTWTAAQMKRLLARVPEFELVETYDFLYDVRRPVVIAPTTEDVVFILRRR